MVMKSILCRWKQTYQKVPLFDKIYRIQWLKLGVVVVKVKFLLSCTVVVLSPFLATSVYHDEYFQAVNKDSFQRCVYGFERPVCVEPIFRLKVSKTDHFTYKFYRFLERFHLYRSSFLEPWRTSLCYFSQNTSFRDF